jgi:cell division protein FtsB
MARSNKQPRSFTADKAGNNHNFFYRLLRNQRFLAFIGLVFLILISFPLIKAYSQKRLIEEEMAQIQKDIDKYEQETIRLQEMIEYLGSEQSLEAQARLNLNLKKPEETVVVIERDIQKADSDYSNKKEENKKSNLKKWRDYFFPPQS